MHKEKNKILYKKILIFISIIIIALAAFFVYKAINQNIQQNKNKRDVELMHEQAIIEISANLDKYTKNSDKQVKAWFVDAAITRSGKVTIVDVEEIYEEKTSSIGIVIREPITDTCKVRDMIITYDEIQESKHE